MSYDVAIWEGELPPSDAEATRVYEARWDRAERVTEPPTDRLLAYIADITSQYPDLTELEEDEVDSSPWADGPLLNNATGSFLYASMTFEGAASEALPRIVEAARRHDLVCFDPQLQRVLT